MNTEHLRYFVTIAQTGSIAAAAARLQRNRSTISMALAALEDQLGCQLFSRSGNSMTLSDTGSRLLDDCLRIDTLVNHIRREAQRDQEPLSLLRIGRDDVLPESFWRRLIRRLHQQHPQLSIEMHYQSPALLQHMLDQQQLDIACCLAVQETPHSLTPRVIGPITLQLVCAADHPLAGLSRVSDDDLAKVPMIRFLEEVDDDTSQRLPGDKHIALSSFELVRDAIADGLGWGLVPHPLLRGNKRQQLANLRYDNNRSWHPYALYIADPQAPYRHFIDGIGDLIDEQFRSMFSE
ncbi:LysR family transcriptional regulator [Bacterioplanoides pacificum]|uniref:LysR family transcriptional regulator n=1 Tax=Bacterioplanoides pacificum TaxID=1171596 RepID=A0ABV7VPP9_9GAMM